VLILIHSWNVHRLIYPGANAIPLQHGGWLDGITTHRLGWEKILAAQWPWNSGTHLAPDPVSLLHVFAQ
jgi:hypothetical protein